MTDNLKEHSASEAFKIRRNKCFKEDFSGFDCIKPINIVIGRNNSGKSVLLDMVEFLVEKNNTYRDKEESKNEVDTILDARSEFLFSKILSEETLKRIFPDNVISGPRIENFHLVGSKLLSCPIEFHTNFELKPQVRLLESPFETLDYRYDHVYERAVTKEEHDQLACRSIADRIGHECIPDRLSNKTYRRLSAERNVVSEGQYDGLSLGINGTGASNIIRAFLHEVGFGRDIIQVSLLEGLNSIFEPDNTFTEIASRYHQSDKNWEIFLNEAKKGLIPLSKSGSGLKTILLVLLNLLIIPKIPGNHPLPADYIFAFEELENNLHPSLLRRLYRFIEDFAKKERSIFFITTHSSTAIDFFSQSDSAQIVHVTHDGEQAKTETVHHFVGQNAVLDDLGVRASDLLQANGIVWLEGPSDRIYFNKWVEIYSNGCLYEHRDYECAFYGGTILSHYQAADPNDDGDFVNIFRINRNAILLADSDRKTAISPLKERVVRMKEQIEQSKGLIWVFDAKEIENYISPECIQHAYKMTKELPPLGKNNSFTTYWKKHKIPGTFNKVRFAQKIVSFLTNKALASRFDLPERMLEICSIIKSWQGKANIDAVHSEAPIEPT